MTFDIALKLLLIAYASLFALAVVAGSLFTVRLVVKIVRRK